MIEFMDGIVEATGQFVNDGVENLIIILGLLAKVVILLTAPAWILPYKLIRIMQDKNGGKCENPDCENCQFPPCQKGDSGND